MDCAMKELIVIVAIIGLAFTAVSFGPRLGHQLAENELRQREKREDEMRAEVEVERMRAEDQKKTKEAARL